MALVQFEISRHNGGKFGCDENYELNDRRFAIVLASGLAT
jgi:hypothetical protein